MTTTIRRQVIKQCPFKNEVDVGELVVIIPGKAPELHRLDADIDHLSMGRTTHEDFTIAAARMMPPGSQVVTTWQTGKWQVEVREDAETA